MAKNLAQSVDGNLNRQSRALFEALHAATGKFSMFGHQNETSKVITPRYGFRRACRDRRISGGLEQ